MFSNERILALYEETAVLNEQLKKAVDSANKITSINHQEENISDIVKNFNVIQDNNKALRIETNNAIKRIKSISSKLSFLMFIVIFLSCFIAGLSLGYLTFTSYLKDDVLVYEINNIKEIKDKYYSELEILSDYQDKGFKLKSNVLIVPSNSVIHDTDTGQKGIFFD